MGKPSHDPSVFDEPHMRDGSHLADESEAKADNILDRCSARENDEDERVEHSVWDEPALAGELTGSIPKDGLDYRSWLEHRSQQTSTIKSWSVTAVVILLAGPWAIVGAFLGGFFGPDQIVTNVMAIIVFGPVTEEIMKIAAVLYLVEKKPFLFKSPVQIIVGVLAGALVFALLENILYLHFYVPEPSLRLIYWRWTVCVALHVGCSMIACLGLLRIWRDIWQRRSRAEISLAYPYILIAVILHGSYNAFAVALSLTPYKF